MKYPAFEAAMAAGNTTEMLNLYDLEYTRRAQAELQAQGRDTEVRALLWRLHHGPSGKAAQPGFLTGQEKEQQSTLREVRPPQPKPRKPHRHSSQDIGI